MYFGEIEHLSTSTANERFAPARWQKCQWATFTILTHFSWRGKKTSSDWDICADSLSHSISPSARCFSRRRRNTHASWPTKILAPGSHCAKGLYSCLTSQTTASRTALAFDRAIM